MASTMTMNPARRVGIGLLWIVTVLEAAAMGLAGFSKFANPELWRTLFEGWGYPGGVAPVVGAVELGLAILLLAPRLAAWAALGLGVIMVGALATVLTHPGGPMGPVPPLVHLSALAVILAARRRGRWGGRRA